MKRSIGVIFAVGAASSVAMAAPVTLDFEGQGYGDGSAIGNYGGLTFAAEALAFTESLYQSFYNNTTAFPSGDIAMFNASGVGSVAATSGSDFDAISAMASWWGTNDTQQSGSSTSITIEGWDDGVMVGTSTISLAQAFANISLGFTSIDELRFINDGTAGHFWLLDDLTLDFDPQTIPLPTASSLAGLGLLGLGVRRRRESL